MVNTIKGQYLISEKNFQPAPDNGWESIAQELYALKKKKEEIDIEIATKQKILLALSEYKNTVGSQFYVEQIYRKGSVDYMAIPELKNIDLEAYRKPSTSYWKIESY